MSQHQLTFRHEGPPATARCACGAVLRMEDLPHVPPPTWAELAATYLDAQGIATESVDASTPAG